jgi:hypothetical protein
MEIIATFPVLALLFDVVMSVLAFSNKAPRPRPNPAFFFIVLLMPFRFQVE